MDGRVLDLATSRGVRITHVFETHLHNDYVTGGLALSLSAGAAYHVSAAYLRAKYPDAGRIDSLCGAIP